MTALLRLPALLMAWLPLLGVGFSPAPSLAATPEPVSLSDRVGPEIDADERARYGLFPDIKDFQSGRFEASKNAYRLIYVENGDAARSRARSITTEAFRQTAWHVSFADEYGTIGGSDSLTAATSEPELLRRLVLRYAARKRYDLARVIAADLREAHAAEPAGAWAAEAMPRLEALGEPRRALIWPGSLLDQRGRTDLIVFSGYYGLWLGVALPAALDADDTQAYAAGLLAAPTISALIAVQATKNASIPRGQATIISLGGHFGTWQGLGWSSLSDLDGNEVLGTGVAAGLAGIVLAIPLSNAVGFSEGHAQITNSAMYWGGWFGLVESVITGSSDRNEDSPLIDMLVGSDIGLLAGGIAGRRARLTTGRMRLINLCGVLGTAFGGGLALLSELGGEGAMAMLGAGSVAGLVLGIQVTRDYDRGKDLASGAERVTIEPLLAVRPAGRGRAGVPTAGFRISF